MGTYLRARKRLPIFLVVLAAGAAATPSTASAAPWRCEASALTGSLLNGTVQLPTVRANAGAVGCTAQSVGAGLKLPSPLDSSALVAQTYVTGTADNAAAQTVAAVGGIADLRVKALPDLPIALPAIPIPDSL